MAARSAWHAAATLGGQCGLTQRLEAGRLRLTFIAFSGENVVRRLCRPLRFLAKLVVGEVVAAF